MEKTYTLENLGCANCAAKIEKKIKTLAGIEQVTLTFATRQLKVTATNPDTYLEEIQNICSRIESGVIVSTKKRSGLQDDNSDHAQKHTLRQIIAGTALFLVAQFILPVGEISTIALFTASYLILGGKIVLKAAKNLTKGNIFDENFLMSIATLGAFAIQEYPEAVGVMLFFRIGEYFEHRAVAKSRSQIMAAIDMRPETVNLIDGDTTKTIDANDANINDLLLVKPGDRIPLDGKIINGESRIDTSPINGEPVPVKISSGDSVLSGCINLSGALTLQVEKILEDSMVSRILASVENAAAKKPQIDRFITKFARIYTPIVLIIALITAIVPSLITGNWSYYIYTALTFLVISCPCALVLSVPLAFFSGIGAGSKVGILFKGGNSLESLKNIKAIAMDKTGTITKGNFTVQKILAFANLSADQILATCAAVEVASTHPIAAGIRQAIAEKNVAISTPDTIEELAGMGIKATLDNKQILCGNKKLLEHFNVSIPEKSEENDFGTEVWLAVDGKAAGCLLIADTLKEDAKDAIAIIKQAGIKTVMLTGDIAESAQSIAHMTGIDETYSRLMPEDKVKHLDDIRQRHGSVMFVGDGINDAPVLAGADVGAAMGTGADAALEAADVVFMKSSMLSIATAIQLAKKVGTIAKQNIILALGIKLIIMILGLCGYASMWGAVFADTGVSIVCILNSVKVLYQQNEVTTV